MPTQVRHLSRQFARKPQTSSYFSWGNRTGSGHLMFAVGRVDATHNQWTVGEFAYVYWALCDTQETGDFQVSHCSGAGYTVRVPPIPGIKVPLPHAEPVPIRIDIHHGLGIHPKGMGAGFIATTQLAIADAAQEVVRRCPTRKTCICTATRKPCSPRWTRSDFLIGCALIP